MLLSAVVLAGVTVIRRAGVQPMREAIGGDIMVARGRLDLEVRSGGAYSDLSEFSLFDAADLTARLEGAGFPVTETLFVPAYVYLPGDRPGQPVALFGRSVTAPGPSPPMDEGRPLDASDAGLPRLAGPDLRFIRGAGQVLRIRVPRLLPPGAPAGSGSAGTGAGGEAGSGAGWVADLASGQDYDFTVVGVSHRPVQNTALVAPLDFLRAATGCTQVHWVSVPVADYSRLEEEADRFRALLPDYVVFSSEDFLAMIDTESAKLQAAALPIMLMVLGVGCIAVLNTALLLSRLRRQEVALMKVMGFSATEIAAAFVLEGLTATALGALVGYVVGGFIGAGMGRFGLGLSWVSASYVLSLVIVVTLVATVPPAVVAARRLALEVLRNA